MKKLMLLLIILLVAGCSHKQMTVIRNDVQVQADLWSFFQETKFGDLSWDPNTGLFTVSDYSNDASQLMKDLFEAGFNAGRLAK